MGIGRSSGTWMLFWGGRNLNDPSPQSVPHLGPVVHPKCHTAYAKLLDL